MVQILWVYCKSHFKQYSPHVAEHSFAGHFSWYKITDLAFISQTHTNIITSADCSWSTQHLHMQFKLYLYKHRQTHSICTFSHILPLTLPLITPIRHRKENENIFLFPLTPPASPFFMVVHAGTPSGSTLGFKEQLMCHMAPLSVSSLQCHTDLQPSLASGLFFSYLPPLPSLFILEELFVHCLWEILQLNSDMRDWKKQGRSHFTLLNVTSLKSGYDLITHAVKYSG